MTEEIHDWDAAKTAEAARLIGTRTGAVWAATNATPDGSWTTTDTPQQQPVYAVCRRMETRTCPPSYNGPCGDRPCARFESDDATPWLTDAGDTDPQHTA